VSRYIVTLDGPAGVGKTTLAKRVAAELGVAYLDTGAMFRALAWKLGEGSWKRPEDELGRELSKLGFSLHGSGEDSYLKLAGQELPETIRTEQVGLWASNLGTLQVVRDFLKAAQRDVGRQKPLVAEGRDQGTIVFPDARHKFFLDATPEERALRRYHQLQDMNQEADLEEITLKIKIRDAQDRNRPIAPLRPAEDAVLVDTTELAKDEVFERIMEAIGEDRP
jgi:cytidylate kinase